MESTHNGVKYKFFWNGVFSNWYPSYFTIDDIRYNCVEQYMMYQKALTFGDEQMAEKILKEPSPREQKKYGRQVRNYNDEIWSSVRYEIVKNGLREKFNQNKSLKDYLLKYKGFEIVEASPYDRIWGIGYHEELAIQNIDNWGENLLGKMLTELTNELP